MVQLVCFFGTGKTTGSTPAYWEARLDSMAGFADGATAQPARPMGTFCRPTGQLGPFFETVRRLWVAWGAGRKRYQGEFCIVRWAGAHLGPGRAEPQPQYLIHPPGVAGHWASDSLGAESGIYVLIQETRIPVPPK